MIIVPHLLNGLKTLVLRKELSLLIADEDDLSCRSFAARYLFWQKPSRSLSKLSTGYTALDHRFDGTRPQSNCLRDGLLG